MPFSILVSSLLVFSFSLTHAQESNAVELRAVDNCPSATLYSDVTYESLRSQLEKTFAEKNKSLIFLDFRGLQAQVDVLTSHLLNDDKINPENSIVILEKTIEHLDQLATLLTKSKEVAKFLKEEHVVPLATLTSMKAEADACTGSPSQFSEIFKTLSQLNKDLNEVLMISPNRITAQREKAYQLLKKIKSLAADQPVPVQNIAENFNFIQKHITQITKTFEVDLRILNIAGR